MERKTLQCLSLLPGGRKWVTCPTQFLNLLQSSTSLSVEASCLMALKRTDFWYKRQKQKPTNQPNSVPYSDFHLETAIDV